MKKAEAYFLKNNLKNENIQSIFNDEEIMFEVFGDEFKEIKAAIKEKEEMLNQEIIFELNDELYINEIDDKFVIQSIGFSVILKQRKVLWVNIPIGYDIVSQSREFNYILPILGTTIGVMNLITNISVLWKGNLIKDNAEKFGIGINELIKSQQLMEIIKRKCPAVAQMSLTITEIFTKTQIPRYVFRAIEVAWKTIKLVLNFSLMKLIIYALNLGTPSLWESISIIRNVHKYNSVTFHYTTILYSGYSYR